MDAEGTHWKCGCLFLCLNLTRQNWTVNMCCINMYFYTVFLHIIHYSKQGYFLGCIMRFFFIFWCTSAYRKPLKNKGIWVGIFQYSRVGIFPCGMCENGAYMGLYNLTERKYFFNKIPQITPSIVYIIFPHTHSLTKTLVKWG